MIRSFILLLTALICSGLASYPIVLVLRFFKADQSIRQEGPASHQAKAGTPTMGGLGFVLTLVALCLIFLDFEFDLRYLALILLTLGFALIGLADDLLKVMRKKNLGLTFWQKIFLQAGLAGVFVLFLIRSGTQLSLGPFLADLGLTNPILYFLFSIFVVIGAANATNLTDGLNGLLAGTAGLAFLAFGVLAHQTGQPDAVIFAFLASGAILAFLSYNFPNAKVFMGDVGSLAIGAALAGLALIMHQELRLIIIGGIFVVEALSVILQVASYKLFKKRIFKMTPIHHHFELLGIPERYVVIGFWVVAMALGIVGVII